MWDFERYQTRTAVITEHGEELTYADLKLAADGFAAHLSPRCLVFCLCTNELAALVGYVGCLQRRSVAFMGEAHPARAFIDRLRAAYRPDYIWCPSSMAADVVHSQVVYAACGYMLLKLADAVSVSLHDDLALLLTTSGSTGSPKLVRLSYRNLQSNTASIVDYLHLNSDERAITTLPMSYTYGLSIINTHLAVGATIVLTSKTLVQREFWHLFREQRVTSFGGVPYTYEMLEKLRFFRMDLPSLRTMTQAGGRLEPDVQRRFADHANENGRDFIVMYGQTEATARISYLPASECIRRCGSVGRAIPGGKLYLTADDGRVVTDSGTTGELVYEGENVMLGYSESGADLSRPDELHGVLRTGDLATFDADGYFYIVGRTKRFVKVFGNRINLDEVEAMVRFTFPAVECACVGRDDQIRVYVAPPGEPAEIQAYLSGALGIHFTAFSIRQVDRITRSTAGKILYSQLDD
jgi:acyl-CoA synthetase (AMP-forming)/AMP-acid ligase II